MGRFKIRSGDFRRSIRVELINLWTGLASPRRTPSRAPSDGGGFAPDVVILCVRGSLSAVHYCFLTPKKSMDMVRRVPHECPWQDAEEEILH